MYKEIILIGLVSILATLTACGSFNSDVVSTPPSTIQDSQLISAWFSLYNQTELVRLWDGSTVTGHDLALFVLEHAIPVVWGSEEICHGNSCCKQYCIGDNCTNFHEKLGRNPIIITPALHNLEENLDELIGTLAHEIYHYMEPFGNVEVTMLEEYSAHYVGEALAAKSLQDFKGINPLQPTCLVKWFDSHYLFEAYKHLKAYPSSILAKVDSSSKTCADEQNMMDVRVSDHHLTCILNSDNHINCYFPPTPSPTPAYRVVCKTNEKGYKGCDTIWLVDEISANSTPNAP